ncbi:MAG TPA: hypothetical protein ENL22_09310 [candidate division Zixibacteria bacterium]|nr:hypothetical protein [candidate division Zixibacteria bacterium]
MINMIKSKVIFTFVTLIILGQVAPAVDQAIIPLEKKIDSIFVIASSAELKYRDMVEPAKDSIAAIGSRAVPRLVELFKSNTAREKRTVEQILKKIGRPAVPYLRKSLLLDDYRQVSRICYSLGEIGDSSAVADLINIAGHERWQVRSGCAGALGKIGDKRADQIIIQLLSDSVETVRKSAAVAAGKLLIDTAIEKLVHMLGDNFYGPRMCASEALVKIGGKSIKPIVDSLDSENIMVGDLGCSTLGNIGGDLAAVGVARQLKSNSPARRALAVKAIFQSNSSLACGLVELLKGTESDPMVLFHIDKTLKKYASQ